MAFHNRYHRPGGGAVPPVVTLKEEEDAGAVLSDKRGMNIPPQQLRATLELHRVHQARDACDDAIAAIEQRLGDLRAQHRAIMRSVEALGPVALREGARSQGAFQVTTGKRAAKTQLQSASASTCRGTESSSAPVAAPSHHAAFAIRRFWGPPPSADAAVLDAALETFPSPYDRCEWRQADDVALEELVVRRAHHEFGEQGVGWEDSCLQFEDADWGAIATQLQQKMLNGTGGRVLRVGERLPSAIDCQLRVLNALRCTRRPFSAEEDRILVEGTKQARFNGGPGVPLLSRTKWEEFALQMRHRSATCCFLRFRKTLDVSHTTTNQHRQHAAMVESAMRDVGPQPGAVCLVVNDQLRAARSTLTEFAQVQRQVVKHLSLQRQEIPPGSEASVIAKAERCAALLVSLFPDAPRGGTLAVMVSFSGLDHASCDQTLSRVGWLVQVRQDACASLFGSEPGAGSPKDVSSLIRAIETARASCGDDWRAVAAAMMLPAPMGDRLAAFYKRWNADQAREARAAHQRTKKQPYSAALMIHAPSTNTAEANQPQKMKRKEGTMMASSGSAPPPNLWTERSAAYMSHRGREALSKAASGATDTRSVLLRVGLLGGAGKGGPPAGANPAAVVSSSMDASQVYSRDVDELQRLESVGGEVTSTLGALLP